ncbi:MAG: polysaccharide pyruvyl transferase family protein [Actinomycetota bacterium]
MAEHYALFGAAADTWNLGVTALMESTVLAVHRSRPAAGMVVFDNGFGERSGVIEAGGQPLRIELRGARHSRRLHRGDTLWTIRAASVFGGLGNGAAQRIRTARAVFDLSGGDSFTDLYGAERLRQILLHKQIVLSLRTPLVLLPQTYGPFRSERAERAAAKLVRGAAAAWARDPISHERLRDLLGADFDADRHRLGVDVAFGLPPLPPSSFALPAPLSHWLGDDRDRPVVGLNVSGLCYRSAESAAALGLTVDYPKVIHGLVDRLLAESDARIVLLAHVRAPIGHEQSDQEANFAAFDRLSERDRQRVVVAPLPSTASEAKGLISLFDWFCGTRMHSTIAALGSGVPTGGLAYSIKMAGVFELCDQAEHVADATVDDDATVLDRLWWSWEHREQAERRLAPARAVVVSRAMSQLDEVLGSAGLGAGAVR